MIIWQSLRPGYIELQISPLLDFSEDSLGPNPSLVDIGLHPK